MAGQRYAFLDKDGTLIDNVAYNVDPARVTLARGVESLATLAGAGFRFALISNQPGIALALFPERALADVERRIDALLRPVGISLDAFFYCPHHPDGSAPGLGRECSCRKPRPGLLLAAADALGADLARSWMIGDTLDDVEAGHAAGCRSALVNNGGETEWVLTDRRRPDLIGRDLAEVVEGVLALEAGHAHAGASR